MAKGNKSENSSTNLNEFGSTSSRSSGSEGSLDSAPDQRSSKNQRPVIYTILFVLALIVLFTVYMLLPQPIKYDNVQFNFRKYCPIFYEQRLVKKEDYFRYLPFTQETLDLNEEKFKKIYVVEVKNHFTQLDLVTYCGLTRNWNQSCQQAKYTCSTPGPAFDLDVNQEANVFWINNVVRLNQTAARQPFFGRVNQCYQEGTLPPRCHQKAKTQDWVGCTYNDPTDLGVNDTTFKRHTIGADNFPVSTHVHGLEVRPYFDGNPLSWFSQKYRGIGYMSAEQQYFNIISAAERKVLLDFYNATNKSWKLNVYPNTQLPGSLWYHDHAMASTGFNVMKGLSGMYILRDWKIENQFPKGEYEKMMLLAINHGAYSNETTVQNPDHKTETYFNNELKSDAYYRFRILNSDFDAHYRNVMFFYNNTQGQIKNLSFYIIGSDSAIIRYSNEEDWGGFMLEDLYRNNFTVASAERIDILIRFPSSQIPVGSIINVTQDANRSNIVQTIYIKEKQTDPQILNYTIPSKIDVPYTDLRKIPDSQVKKRMRPLVRSSDFAFGINGHVVFSDGASENPQIGTTEDWYFINTMVQNHIDHPIHVHLINYQVTQKYSLIQIGSNTIKNCTFYEMQFYLENANCTDTTFQTTKTKYMKDKNNLTMDEYQAICNYIQNNNTENLMIQCFKDFANQADFDENKISGLNVMKTDSSLPDVIANQASAQNCDMDNHRYACKNVSSKIPTYLRSWKEVALMASGYATVVRIRWTKTAYDANVDGSNYFHVDEKQLIEFPGYVYHCHFLNHQDHEMMRPIMMRLSDDYKEQHNIPNDDYWKSIYSSINNNMNCGPNNPRKSRFSKPNNDLRR